MHFNPVKHGLVARVREWPHSSFHQYVKSGDLLAKLGRYAEARPEFERAASLTRNAKERELLLERARSCADSGSSGPA